MTSSDDARIEIAKMKEELDSTFARYEEGLSDMEPFLQEDFHKYMCIRLAGFIQQVVLEAVSGYLGDSGESPIGNFARSYLSRNRFPNMTPDAMINLLRRFGPEWEADLAKFLAQGERRNALDALVRARNKVAHGRSIRYGLNNTRAHKDLADEIHLWVLNRILA